MLQLRPISVPHSQDYLESSGNSWDPCPLSLCNEFVIMYIWKVSTIWALFCESLFSGLDKLTEHFFLSHLISSHLLLSFSLCLSRLYDGTNHRAISLTVWSGYSVTGDIVTTTTAIKPVSLIYRCCHFYYLWDQAPFGIVSISVSISSFQSIIRRRIKIHIISASSLYARIYGCWRSLMCAK